MDHDRSGTLSVWMDQVPSSPLNPLREDLYVDVVVVGAGIAGMTVAYELARRGKRVVVLDDGPIGGGETSRTTAHLVNALDERYRTLERMFGQDGARTAAESHTAAVNRIEQIVTMEGIDCSFTRVDGHLFVPPAKAERREKLIQEELEASRRAGVMVEVVNGLPQSPKETGPVLRYPNQAQFHPMKYLGGLSRAILARGGRIYTGSHAATIEGGSKGRPGQVVTSDGRTVRCGHIVVCTNTPVNDRVTMHTKQMPYRSYVVGLRVARGTMRPMLVWDGFWEEGDEFYHYVRLAEGANASEDVLIVGGEDHKVGHEAGDQEARYARLERWARLYFPQVHELLYTWSGQIMEPADELGFIGRNPGDETVYIVTGDSGNGMTHGTIGGMLIPDLIEGKEHPWAKLYSPSRLPIHAVGSAIAENAEALAQYKDWAHIRSHEDVEKLKPGHGVVIRVHGRPVAVYRTMDGHLMERSAVCPHLYGVVRWNEGERTWDCPVHGSRFDCNGCVVNGPANSDLAELAKTDRVSGRRDDVPGRDAMTGRGVEGLGRLGVPGSGAAADGVR